MKTKEYNFNYQLAMILIAASLVLVFWVLLAVSGIGKSLLMISYFPLISLFGFYLFLYFGENPKHPTYLTLLAGYVLYTIIIKTLPLYFGLENG